MNPKTLVPLASALLVATLALAPVRCPGQGALTPPGPPAPTMKSLDQIEPRIPILSLPIVITNSGSYYLTTNLTGVSGYNGITILTNNVTLDLRGFTLFGAPGAQSGIWVPGNTVSFALKNGTVRDWPFSGVDADESFDSQFSQLSLENNGADGLRPGADSVIDHCIADGNAYEGFGGNNGYECTFDACTAENNGDAGFFTYSRCRLFNCDANDNVNDGFDLDFQCTAKNCTAGFNGAAGVDINYIGCLADDCVCDDDDVGFLVGDHSVAVNCAATHNTDDGINSLPGSTIQSSIAGWNGGYGIDASNDCVVTGCTADTNQLDNIITGSGCTLDHCSAGYSRAGNGFTLGAGSTLSASSALGNATCGIAAGGRTTIHDCTASFNGSAGIQISVLDTVRDCSCVNNGLYGILENNNGDSVIQQNNCSYNGTLAYSGAITTGAGIFVTNSAGCRIEGNTVDFNYAGLVVAPLNQALILRNSADANVATNFVLGAGNSWGPIVNVTAGGDISTIPNSSHPGANFIH